MSKVVTLGLADGRSVQISGVSGSFSSGVPGSLYFQFLDSTGQPSGPSGVIAQDHYDFSQGPITDRIDVDHFVAVALPGGGFEVAYDDFTGDEQGITHSVLRAAAVSADGHVIPDFSQQLDFSGMKVSGFSPSPPQLYALAHDRFALAAETFDEAHGATSHVFLAGPAGFIADVAVGERPTAVAEAPGDVTIHFADGTQEIVGLTGAVLAARGASHEVTVVVGSPAGGFVLNAQNDQLFVANPDGSAAGGPASVLTFDAGSHTVSWDSDGQGPSPEVLLGDVAASVTTMDAANLADNFRPAVLKVIAQDGSSTIQWFDTDGSHNWDTLVAQEDVAGGVLSYHTTLDDGSGQLYTFDVANAQPWQRVVDDLDPSGHVLQRTVLYDDGQFWTAKFVFIDGAVNYYELDNFDAQGVLVAKGFFNADGTPI